jgi:hypothetical protein
MNTTTMDEKSLRKIQEYKDRYRFWSDKRISQLSFHNNLLLTLGIAAIGYFWKERDSVYKNLIIDFHSSIDWKVFLFFVGIAILFLSVLSGFLLSLSRLYDLRLTGNIVLTRRRLAEKAMNLKDQLLLETGLFSSIKSLWSVFWNYRQYEIAKTSIEADESILQNRFTLLRQKSEDLGTSTWALLKCQTVCMFVSMVFLIIVLFIK